MLQNGSHMNSSNRMQHPARVLFVTLVVDQLLAQDAATVQQMNAHHDHECFQQNPSTHWLRTEYATLLQYVASCDNATATIKYRSFLLRVKVFGVCYGSSCVGSAQHLGYYET